MFGFSPDNFSSMASEIGFNFKGNCLLGPAMRPPTCCKVSIGLSCVTGDTVFISASAVRLPLCTVRSSAKFSLSCLPGSRKQIKEYSLWREALLKAIVSKWAFTSVAGILAYVLPTCVFSCSSCLEWVVLFSGAVMGHRKDHTCWLATYWTSLEDASRECGRHMGMFAIMLFCSKGYICLLQKEKLEGMEGREAGGKEGREGGREEGRGREKGRKGKRKRDKGEKSIARICSCP